jgi:hypothetical protein
MKIFIVVASLFCVGLLMPVTRLSAQQQQQSAWFASFNTVKLNNRFSFYFDGQIRSSDDWVHLQSLLLRPGLNFQPNKSTIVTAGYAFIHNRTVKNSTSGYFTEHRFWQQLLLLQPVNKTTLQHRFRFEERLIPQIALTGTQLKKESNALATRLRYFNRILFPLQNPTPFTRGLFVALQNEVFVNISNANATNNNFFDQNRAYAAFGYRLAKTVDAEMGYMNQYINARTTGISNHIIQMATYLRL